MKKDIIDILLRPRAAVFQSAEKDWGVRTRKVFEKAGATHFVHMLALTEQDLMRCRCGVMTLAKIKRLIIDQGFVMGQLAAHKEALGFERHAEDAVPRYSFTVPPTRELLESLNVSLPSAKAVHAKGILTSEVFSEAVTQRVIKNIGDISADFRGAVNKDSLKTVIRTAIRQELEVQGINLG